MKITPEMIEAGVEAYYAIDRRVADDVEYIVTSILRAAMVRRTQRNGESQQENGHVESPKGPSDDVLGRGGD